MVVPQIPSAGKFTAYVEKNTLTQVSCNFKENALKKKDMRSQSQTVKHARKGNDSGNVFLCFYQYCSNLLVPTIVPSIVPALKFKFYYEDFWGSHKLNTHTLIFTLTLTNHSAVSYSFPFLLSQLFTFVLVIIVT